MLDIHSHILPQVDDGSQSMQMTHGMFIEANRAGIDTIIATPHFRSIEINREKILQAFTQVQKDAYKYGIKMQLGFEVHISMLAHLEMSTIIEWCIQGTNVILLEFPAIVRPAKWDITVCDLVQNGYKPIIVHPERCVYIQQSLEMAIELKRYGCELQVDAMSLGKSLLFSNPEGRTAEKLIRKGIVDYIASDAHRPEHYRQFGRAYKKNAHRLSSNGILNKMTHDSNNTISK
jgi:protein-tyrosine phosphatase